MYRDFDKFIDELEKKEIKFKLFGKEWVLPSELPVSIVLKAVKAKDDEEEAFKMLAELLGKKQFNELVKLGITMEVMVELLTWSMEMYTGGKSDKKVGK